MRPISCETVEHRWACYGNASNGWNPARKHPTDLVAALPGADRGTGAGAARLGGGRARRIRSGDGALDGIPFAAKDTFETRGLSTEFGSSIYAGRKGATDAALVTQLRRLGAILLGKTQTTVFASFDPSPTRNPHNPAHTPGGSSSGSAAAVAAGMAAFSLGSQTQGSVGRPASYCGVAGFKPTYGLLPTEGLFPFAPTLDTPGLFTQDADDMRLLWSRMGYSHRGERSRHLRRAGYAGRGAGNGSGHPPNRRRNEGCGVSCRDDPISGLGRTDRRLAPGESIRRRPDA